MSNDWGTKIQLSIFGESHGNGIGIVIGGLPPGEPVNEDEIAKEMQRRAPGNSLLSTPRKEADKVEIVSGIFEGKTTGAPVCGMIRNENTRSRDYDPSRPRPGHADLSAHIKYKGNQDYRGGGHFSGRLTAPLVFAGAIAKQILKRKGVMIGAHIRSIANVEDIAFSQIDEKLLEGLNQLSFPVLLEEVHQQMEDAVLKAKADGDSVGGIIECAAYGVPAGLGDPFFGSVESKISSLMYAIPAVKGVSFGSGFAISKMRGSEANDPIALKNGMIVTETNHNGGINGGITNGMPIIVQTAIKPTPSISKPQHTVNLETMQEDTLEIIGRHDPCIVPRAVVVTEAVMALSILDLWSVDCL